MALVVAMMAVLLMTALGAALILTTSVETLIAGNFRNGQEGLYAADAAIERAMADITAVADWNTILNGSVRSAFIDGAPSGSRRLPDGSTLDLTEVVNMADCRSPSACSDWQMNAVTGERPWGANNPRWQLYAYGPLNRMLPAGTIDSPYYAIVLVADDPAENDADPLRDGTSPTNPGSGVLAMRAEAFGPRGAHKVVEATLSRTDSAEPGYIGARLVSWRELR